MASTPSSAPRPHHFPRAVTNFLRRLENPAPAQGSRASGFQRQESAQQDRRMRIVAAGVHDPGVPRAIGSVVLLNDGKGV